MDLKKYEKTRYQNIYRNIKNKNYVIMISKPVKTSIASVDGKKIMKLEDALKIRDNPKIKYAKGIETLNKEYFDTLWYKYIDWCKYEAKLAYSTLIKKKKQYNKYLKNKFDKKITKLTKQELIIFIEKLECCTNVKNEIIKTLKAFFNWCIKQEYIYSNPMSKVEKYKVEKPTMKYWTPEELKKFINTLTYDINKNINKEWAYRIKILTLIGFNLGDRFGETRALTFDCFDKIKHTVKIKHSINYDTSSDDFLSFTKNYHSQRVIDVSHKLIEEIEKYKYYLINECNLSIKDDSIIFLNYSTNRPYSDTSLRTHFYSYCEEAKVPKIRVYDLRHTYVATMMAEGKELYLISERLGHSNYSTTVNKYGHLSNKIRKEIAEITDKYY